MKLTEYLKDKVLLLLLHMVCMAGLVIFLRLTGYSMDKCVIILVCDTSVSDNAACGSIYYWVCA